MTSQNTPTTVDPHGYFPVIVDETVLTPDDRREQLYGQFRSDAADNPAWQWLKSLTPEERKMFRDRQKHQTRSTGPTTGDDLDSAGQAQAARQRAYARDRFSEGQRVWYGDGIPPWL